ncbi:MAG: SH3 domain-containing protein [Acidaminococcaceae bacterium]|nr:SH3 domain-containing protein [Acidaminococcaceae bacterium]
MFFALLLVSPPVVAGIVDSGELTEPSFWILNNNAGDRVVLDEEEIRQFNRKICDMPLDVTEMKSIPESIPVKEFLPWITNTWAMRGAVYLNGKEVTEAEKETIQKNLNLAALPGENETVTVQYGVTVRHAMVRNLPLADGLFDEPDDVYYDNVQDSVLEAGEPVAILHESMDKKYYYVRLYNLFGWISREEVALCDREQWLKYADPQDFLVVTGRDYFTRVNGEDVFHLMGAKLQLLQEKKNRWQVLLPYKDSKSGLLKEKQIWLMKDRNLHRGFLPYTSDQVIRQAFKFYGSVYGWGGAMRSVDCSSLVGSVYRTMGLDLPRNTFKLVKMPGEVTDFTGMNREERLQALAKLKPGSPLSMRGHIMIYLGMNDGVPYVIHSSSSYYKEGRKIYVRRVLVSDLEMNRKNGKSYLDTIVNGITYR